MVNFERGKGPTFGTTISLFVILIVAVAVGFAVMRRVSPLNPTVIRSAASFCRRDYAEARTRSDTLATDQRVWQVDKRPWHRLPSCGELRTSNRL